MSRISCITGIGGTELQAEKRATTTPAREVPPPIVEIDPLEKEELMRVANAPSRLEA